MKPGIALTALALLLVGCAKASTTPEERLLSHDWSPKAEFCKELYVRFTKEAIELQNPWRGTTQLKVWDVVVPPKAPDTVMVVTSLPSATRPPDEDLGAFLFDLSGNRMKLIAQGPPQKMLPVSPDDLNAKRFDLAPCPTA